MNILYISPRFPYPADQGDKVVIYNHLKFLSRTNRITFLSLFQNEKELDGISGLSDFCSKIEVYKKRPNLSPLNLIYAVFKTVPFTVIRYYSPKLFKKAKQLIESGGFDMIHTAFYYMGQYVVDKRITVPKNTAAILDTHNIEYLIYSRFARLARNPAVKLLTYLEALRIKRYEVPIYKKFDRCIAFSKLDKDNIAGLSGASNIVVNPSCIELPASGREAPSRGEEKNTVFFFGLLNTPANDDAIKFFYENIFSEVKEKIPDIKFVIAGKHPSRYVLNLRRDPCVRFLGPVDDMKGLLKKTALVIAPLRLGGGTRIKILEAWAAGKAVVSTSIGAQGVEASNGADIIIADSASDFANSVVNLLNNESVRRQIGEAAFRKAAEYYSPGRIIGNLEAIYRQVLSEKLAKR